MSLQRLLIPLVALFVLATTSTEASQLDEKMSEVAQRVLALTRGQQVAVGVFSPTGLPDTNFGPGCKESLITALEKQRAGSVNKRANFEVKGDYVFVGGQDAHAVGLTRVVTIVVRVIDLAAGAKEVGKLSVRIDHTKTIAKVTQQTVALPANGSKKERNKILADAVQNPTARISGPNHSVVSCSKSSKVGVEVLVRRSLDAPARPRRAEMRDDVAFVDIQKGELYEVKLYNRYPREIAATLSIDGIDMYHFSQDRGPNGKPLFSHVVVPPRSEAVIIGWHNSLSGNENYKSFLVTSYGKGVRGQAGVDANGEVGVIHVQFSFTKKIPIGGRAAPGKETGFGPPRKVNQKPVRREFDPPHEFVTVRYAR